MKEILDFEGTPEDAFAVYQLKYSHENHLRRFEPLQNIRSRGLPVQREQYDLRFAAPLKGSSSNIYTCLDELYLQFSTKMRGGPLGYSFAVGDVVALKLKGQVYSFFVDEFGFTSLPGFFGPDTFLKNARIATEVEYDENDGVIHNGTPSTLGEQQRQIAEKKAQLEAEPLTLVSFQGKPALLADWRIDASLLPDGLYHYDLRHGEDWGTPITAETYVRVNFFGTILLKEPLPVPVAGRMDLSKDTIDYLDGSYLSIADFLKSQPTLLDERRASIKDSLKKAEKKPAKPSPKRRKHMVR